MFRVKGFWTKAFKNAKYIYDLFKSLEGFKLKYCLLFYNFIFIIITLFVKWKIKFKFKQQS